MSTAASRPRSEVLRIILMGVAGCGKTSVGRALGDRLGIGYVDGDDLHPPANIARMSAGIPLTDADRWPWLSAVAAVLEARAPVIVGCSALRRAYRDHIRAGAGGPVTFIHLAGSKALITERMSARQGHFMPTSLIDSQFAALEAPEADEGAITVDIAEPLDEIIPRLVAALEKSKP